ncbi:response regulator transcription factor [Kutzneria buriramensis]|uniref:DNA-binding NarL/FixJ family response regulator n=1 Tax=Kutzneria buriramensis TaxID=1045776 RepID=A0A3E0H1S3_9PSEU|nr:response regulator transcription factor [Kutzneria buriramensis]REH37052.1 DNA-binding NarL/FixJ family response regulator [Kutzneria buriramensis]
MSVRVLLVDDQILMRSGLRKLLEIEDGIEIVADVGSGPDALSVVPACRPDVALVDARMPGMDGIELITLLTAQFPSVASIVLTTFDEDEYLFGALKAGARGFLLKDASPEELVAAIRRAAGGGTVLSDQVAGRVVAQLRGETPVQPALSSREVEVARLVGAGASNREIASQLFITEGTVKNHVSSTLRKLGLRDRTQLALHVTSSPGAF